MQGSTVLHMNYAMGQSVNQAQAKHFSFLSLQTSRETKCIFSVTILTFQPYFSQSIMIISKNDHAVIIRQTC